MAAYSQWGIDIDVFIPADYDIATYRNGIWWTRQSSSGGLGIQNFGLSSDKPVPGSYVN